MKKYIDMKTALVMLNISLIGLLCIETGYTQKSDPLPDGWKVTDVGEPLLPSVTYYNAEEDFYTLSGGGYDTWNTSDECNFVYFETEEDKEVVVRMLDYTGTGWNSKGFIMIRGSLDPGSSMCFLEATPHDGSSIYLSGRKEDKKDCSIFGHISSVEPLFPRWIKFVRQGKYITGYHKDDTEGAQWERVATVQLALKGKAYLGIGVCGGGEGSGYATVSFDQLEVRNIEIPYEVVDRVADQVLVEGKSKTLDVTTLFGHYIGDYWTIQAESSDDSIVSAEFSEVYLENSANGEEYQKIITITGINDGVAVVKLSTNIKGFKMVDEFVVEVNGTTVTETINNMSPPGSWKFNELYSDYFGGKTPFSSNPYKQLFIPGTIEAEDFDIDGYADKDTTNSGGQYRLDVPVDIDLDTSDNHFFVTAFDSTEWLNFTVNIETTGIYKLEAKTSATAADAKFIIALDGKDAIAATTITSTGNINTWSTASVTGIRLNKGKHLLKLYISNNPGQSYIGFDYMAFTLTEEIYNTTTSKMEYGNNMYDSLKILTELWNEDGLEDNLAFLYQDLNVSDSIQMTAYITSLKNTGTGSFAGLMLRQSFDTSYASSPFVAFSAGAYEGLKLNFRWDDGVEVSSLINEDIKLPCWIRMNKFSSFGYDYINTYYSHDGIYWTNFLKYPLNIKFLDDNIVGGIAVCGGRFAQKRKEVVRVKDFEIKINQSFDPMKDINETIVEPVTISPNPVSTTAQVSYKVIRPGKVMITIYNSYGILMNILVNQYHEIGQYTVELNAEKLGKEGIYLLKYIAEGDYQFVKFIYKNQ